MDGRANARGSLGCYNNRRIRTMIGVAFGRSSVLVPLLYCLYLVSSARAPTAQQEVARGGGREIQLDRKLQPIVATSRSIFRDGRVVPNAGAFSLIDLATLAELALVRLPFPLMSKETTSSLRNWAYQGTSASDSLGILAAVSPDEGLYFFQVPGGRIIAQVPDVDTILDQLKPELTMEGTTMMLLARREGALLMIKISEPIGEPILHEIAPSNAAIVGAAFVEAASTDAAQRPTHRVSVVAAAECGSSDVASLLLITLNNAKSTLETSVVEFSGGFDSVDALVVDPHLRLQGQALRLEAVEGPKADLFVALGRPESDMGRGTGAILRLRYDGGGAHVVMPGIPRQCCGGSGTVEFGSCSFGQSVVFVNDCDGDGIRDVVFSAPTNAWGGELCLLSSASGRVLWLWAARSDVVMGSSLCWQLDRSIGGPRT